MVFLGETYGKRDYEAILQLLPDFMYPTGGASGVEETKAAYKIALEAASHNFWQMAMLQPSYNFEIPVPVCARILRGSTAGRKGIFFLN